MNESDQSSRGLPYIIFEVANTHGGNTEIIQAIVEEFSKIDYIRKCIKFQPLSPDLLALPDYPWYSVYKELFLPKEIWSDILSRAAESGDIWLDIFDTYGIEIFMSHKNIIKGIKLQASVLENQDIILGLSKIGVEQTSLMINIAGYDLSQIEHHITQFSKLSPKEIIIQIGFQSYPTSVSDTGLQKIQILKAAFPSIPICFADHSPADIPVSTEIPLWAVSAGCSLIEKHFCLKRNEAKYDAYSSLEPAEFQKMIHSIRDWYSASRGPFIVTAEKEYLEKSYQIAVLRHDLESGGMIALSDLIFRRTGQTGMKWYEISSLQSQGCVLAKKGAKYSTVSRRAFRKARIGVIVACRMKSSRLKRKAILPISNVPSVERCLQNCLMMNNMDEVILATSSLPEDEILNEYTIGGKVQFWQGDPEDVMLRYLGACEKFGIDVIYRVTADCPVVSPEIADILLKSHFETGADFTGAATCAVGSAGEVYNTETLKRVIRYLGDAKHSEYMTWYMKNNPDIFKLNIVDLPPSLVRSYRLTLDYQEDLDMFNSLFRILEEKNLEPNLKNVFSVLDQHSEIVSMNNHLTLSYQTDKALITMLNEITRIRSRDGQA